MKPSIRTEFLHHRIKGSNSGGIIALYVLLACDTPVFHPAIRVAAMSLIDGFVVVLKAHESIKKPHIRYRTALEGSYGRFRIFQSFVDVSKRWCNFF